VQQGDSTVIIAIIDSGVDFFHEDLTANVWTNELEVNGAAGVDDDSNGFVDDFHGWDFGDNDADPIHPVANREFYQHGTTCAGLACAVTNNLKGIAGVSRNCKFMPVKNQSDDDPDPKYGYEGIIYAADNGADIISNSWGYFGYSRWEQEVIDYAFSKGAVIVCAAGNTEIEAPFYPANYHHVISVAAVSDNDAKASYSNFGMMVDICAPGGKPDNLLLSTYPKNKYGAAGGTSAATPIVAGVCALVKSQRPDWSNEQIIRQVLLTADNIDALNPQHASKLGYGRVNAYQALTAIDLQDPDARLILNSFTLEDSLLGNGNGIPEKGETLQLCCFIRNTSIGSATAATMHLSSSSASVEVLNDLIGPVYFLADTTISLDFDLRISENASVEQVQLNLTLESGQAYSYQEHLEIAIGVMPLLFVDDDKLLPDMPDVESFYREILDRNNILYGYWDVEQSGFPEAEELLKFPIVVICTYGLANFNLTDKEFKAVQKYLEGGNHLYICGQWITSVLSQDIGTEEAKTFLRDYLHAQYIAPDSHNRNIIGTTNDPIGHGLSFNIWQPGLASSFQNPNVIAPATGASTIFTYGDGRAAAVKYAGNHKVVYTVFGLEAVDSDENTQIGDTSPIRTELLMRILNWLNFIEHEPLKDIDNVDSSRIVVAGLTGNVTDNQAMTLFWRLQGDENFGSVVMTKNDSGHYTAEIPATGMATKVEYYLTSHHDYYDWSNPVDAPNSVYAYQVGTTDVQEEVEFPIAFLLKQNYPNPFNPSTTIEFALPKSAFVTLKVYNLLGEEVATLIAEKRSAGIHKFNWDTMGLASGVYLYRLETGDPSTGFPKISG
jgi:hypothetical protein